MCAKIYLRYNIRNLRSKYQTIKSCEITTAATADGNNNNSN